MPWISADDLRELRFAKAFGAERALELKELRENFHAEIERWAAARTDQHLARIAQLEKELTHERLTSKHWEREALAYFERLKPFLGQQASAPSEKDRAMQEARDTIETAINRMSNTPMGKDAQLEAHLWAYAEQQLAEKGPSKAKEIAQDIIDGDSA